MTSANVAVIASPGDLLADAISIGLVRRGRGPVVLSTLEAAGYFTIETGEAGSRVTPNMPIFLRPFSAADAREPSDADARFHAAERLGAVWAAAALMQAPVVNRPGPLGFFGRCTSSASITALDCGEFDGRAETYFSGAPADMGIGAGLVEDFTKNEFVPGTSSVKGIYRSRDTTRIDGYYPIAVVGRQCLSCMGNDRLLDRLAPRSLEVADKLDLSFALLYWGVTGEDEPVLTAVSPSPSLAQLGNRSGPIIEALVELLCDPY